MFNFLDIIVYVYMTVKKYASEMSFTFYSSSLTTCYRSTYSGSGTWTKTCYLIPGDYTLSCIDSYGDGWHGGYITILGVKYCSGFSSGKLKTKGPVTITYDSGVGYHGMYIKVMFEGWGQSLHLGIFML